MKLKNLFIASLLCLSTATMAQEFNQDINLYARLGIGTGIRPDFIDGVSFDAESGVNFKGLQAALSVTVWNTLPLDNTNQSISIQTNESEMIGINGINRHISGKRNTSVMVSVGYDLLRFIPGNTRHRLLPYFGIGWSGLTSLRTSSNSPIGVNPDGSHITYGSSIEYDLSSSFDFCAGAKYEYSITDKWGIGLAYKYLDLAESDLLSIYVSRCF